MPQKEMIETTLDQLLLNVSKVKDYDKRKEALYQHLKQLLPEALVKVLIEAAGQTPENEANHGLFCMLLDSPTFLQQINRQTMLAFRQQMAASTRGKELIELIDGLKSMESDEILLIQARFNIWLQIIFLLDYRLVESGFPVTDMSMVQIARLAERGMKEDAFSIRVWKSDFPGTSLKLLDAILSEADFISREDSEYEYSLSEILVKKLATGESISGSGKSQVVSSRITDSMVARQAENLVKRVILAVRGSTMYPPEHPGLPPLIQSCLTSIETLLSRRDLLVLTHLGGELLVDEVHIRSQTKVMKEFFLSLEERKISSITFYQGVTLDEIKHMITIFIQGAAWLKDQGGARMYFMSHNVMHIAVDQYRYGLISSEGLGSVAGVEQALTGQYGGFSGGTGSGGSGGGGNGVSGEVGDAGAFPGMGGGNSGGARPGFGPGFGPGPGGAGPGLGPGFGPGPGGGDGFGAKLRRGPNAEMLLLNEIVSKVGSGESIMTIPSEQIGEMLKKILSGELAQETSAKQSLAELIVSLDPSFLERTIIEQPEIREKLSWAVTRKIIEKTLDKMKSVDLRERLAAIEVLSQIGEIAILRGKSSSIRQILNDLTQSVLEEETDEDNCVHIMDLLANYLRKMILNGELKLAQSILEMFRGKLDAYSDQAASPEISFKCELITRLFIRISDSETLRCLIRQLESKQKDVMERRLEILRLLGTEEVITQLLTVFEGGSRRVRGKVFMTLNKMPEIAGEVIVWQMSNLNDRELFPRRPDNAAMLMEEAWYRARNALGVLANVWHADAPVVFIKAAHDRDVRIRKEVLSVLMHANRPLVTDIARDLLHDSHDEIRSMAVLALKNPYCHEAVEELVTLFQREPRLRKMVVETISSIDHPKSRSFMLEALRLSNKRIRKIYLEDPQLHETAIRFLSRKGSGGEMEILKKFMRKLRNPLRYFYFFPITWLFRSRELMAAVRDAIDKLEEKEREMREEVEVQS